MNVFIHMFVRRFIAGLLRCLWCGKSTQMAVFGVLLLSLLLSGMPQALACPMMAGGKGGHSAEIRPDGTLWTWGLNNRGQLGYDTSTHADPTYSAAPAQVAFDAEGHPFTGIARVAAGKYHTIALKSDGTVWGWGHNADGQLGDGTTQDKLKPAQLPGISNVIQVATGDNFSVVLKSDGTVWAWGDNALHQLGDASADSTIATPLQIDGLTKVLQLAAGSDFMLAVASDGTLWAWGNNYAGQLGADPHVVSHSIPMRIGNDADWSRVAAGAGYSFAVKSDGTLWGWGRNVDNLFGDVAATDFFSPHRIGFDRERTTFAGISQVAAGLFPDITLASDGTIWVCGDNVACRRKP